ncbi:MAG: RdgB/HAM1 family non-canonical purine NTP pyrophosphatase [Micromonosporaceae bacterium]
MSTHARVVVATRNAHKVAEVTRILTAGGAELQLLSLADFPGAPDAAETGCTFAENALIKARAAAEFTGLPAIADDSGLSVDALNGMPGVLSARWAGSHGDDEANLRLVLSQVADVPAGRRGARFVCAAAVVVAGSGARGGERIERVVEGTIEGRLATAPRGRNGFGYDPIFVPEGEERTTAEMAPEEKDAISHRGRAFRALAPVIAELLAQHRIP